MSFATFQISSKTRKLDQKIEQAEETLERIQEIAKIAGETLINLNSKVGRVGVAPSPEDSYKTAQKIRQILDSLGVGDKEILRILEPWLEVFFLDLARAITRPIEENLSNRANGLRQKERRNSSNLTVDEQEELNQINAFLDRISRLKYSDYPDGLLRLVNDAPLADEHTKQQVIAKINGFDKDFLMLKESFYLPNPQPWFQEINRS